MVSLGFYLYSMSSGNSESFSSSFLIRVHFISFSSLIYSVISYYSGPVGLLRRCCFRHSIFWFTISFKLPLLPVTAKLWLVSFIFSTGDIFWFLPQQMWISNGPESKMIFCNFLQGRGFGLFFPFIEEWNFKCALRDFSALPLNDLRFIFHNNIEI